MSAALRNAGFAASDEGLQPMGHGLALSTVVAPPKYLRDLAASREAVDSIAEPP